MDTRPYWPCRCCRALTWQQDATEWVCTVCAFPAGAVPDHTELITLGPCPGRPGTACPICRMWGTWIHVVDHWRCGRCGLPYTAPEFSPLHDALEQTKTPRARFGGERRIRKHTVATVTLEE